MNHPHYTCDATGVTIRHAAPPPEHPRYYGKQPVQFTMHHDCTLEMHGEHFSAKMQLTNDSALGLASMLLFLVRNDLFSKQAGVAK
jgi:hypothetical protein